MYEIAVGCQWKFSNILYLFILAKWKAWTFKEDEIL